MLKTESSRCFVTIVSEQIPRLRANKMKEGRKEEGKEDISKRDKLYCILVLIVSL